MTIELALRPTQQLTTVSNVGARIWRTIGNDPAFACIGAEPILAGWYELELDLEVVKGRICNPCLYPDYGNGVFEHQKIDLPVDVRTGERFHGAVTIMFLQDLKELRFDPTVIPAEFALASLKLRRIGKIDTARQLFFAGWRAQKTWLSKMRFLLGGIVRALVRGPRGYGDFLFGEMKRIAVPQDASNYAVWLEFYDSPGLARDQTAATVLESLVDQPMVSVQFGRAACRDIGCQYWWILGVERG